MTAAGKTKLTRDIVCAGRVTEPALQSIHLHAPRVSLWPFNERQEHFTYWSPRCGKSTVIEKFVEQIQRPVTGFFTREIKEKGRRVGFSIINLDGREGVLAHEDSESPVRVGRYGVNVDELDRIAVPAMIPSKPDEIVVIDEIGKMECYSALFRKTLINTLNSANSVIGSIAQKGSPFIEKMKGRKDVLLVSVSEKNRDSLAAYLLEQIPGR